jgi:protein-L-isoaspartate(D-aspartate) O-methyltransferase
VHEHRRASLRERAAMTGAGKPGFPARLQHLQPQAEPSGRKGAGPAAPLVPQRPLQQAQLAQARPRQAPTGLGLDSQGVRATMADRLREAGTTHPGLLAAVAAVPRHRFVDTALATQAYEDTSLPIGHGQTISKPSVVARMIELLLQAPAPVGLRNPQRPLGQVLEIGGGCGYQAALLSLLATQVFSVERLRPLFDKATLHLNALRAEGLVGDIRLVYGDGWLGHPPNAPYHRIIAAAGGEALPQAWLDQLAVGGRLVAPVTGPAGQGQQLLVVDRLEQGWTQRFYEAVQFVPLKSGIA